MDCSGSCGIPWGHNHDFIYLFILLICTRLFPSRVHSRAHSFIYLFYFPTVLSWRAILQCSHAWVNIMNLFIYFIVWLLGEWNSMRMPYNICPFHLFLLFSLAQHGICWNLPPHIVAYYPTGGGLAHGVPAHGDPAHESLYFSFNWNEWFELK